jgi:ABC-type branched-subunit amino acid transport system ATPase component
MNVPFDKNVNNAATESKFLSVWDIRAYYGESYIVQGVSFDIHEGEILALLGRNGAGKTSRRNSPGTKLSGGEQQMLAIARALCRDIKVLLLDEPYEGLAPVIVQEIAKTLNIIRDQGITTIIVEQNAVAALKLADRAVILDTGTVVYDGSAKEVLDDEALRAKYLAI